MLPTPSKYGSDGVFDRLKGILHIIKFCSFQAQLKINLAARSVRCENTYPTFYCLKCVLTFSKRKLMSIQQFYRNGLQIEFEIYDARIQEPTENLHFFKI